MKKILLSTLLLALPILASAYDIAVENDDKVMIYYNYSSDGKELNVTSGDAKYSGSVVIPEIVTYMGITRKVTCIGSYAFYNCTGLTSVTIPNSVTSIYSYAFEGCTGLKSISIGYGVTVIDEDVFNECYSLEKVIINDIATWCNISFNESQSNPLHYAHHLYSDDNTEITDLVIPNSVTHIRFDAFHGCSGLTSITIPNSVNRIGWAAFSGCSSLTSVNIPNSVTTIEAEVFNGCSSLTSITIPNSVIWIDACAFEGCSGLTSVISLIENPFRIEGKNSYSKTFSLETYNTSTLYVPKGTIDKYKATEGWKDFRYIEEGDGPGSGSEQSAYVKAIAETIPVLISANNGNITVTSEANGQAVAVYTVDGQLLGNATVSNGQATVSTTLQNGNIAVVNVGNKAVKIVMR